jgi:cytoskeletal protein CcmA (bactofilin family)
MWKFQKDDEKPKPAPAPSATPVTSGAMPATSSARHEVRPVENRMPEIPRTANAHIGKSVVIKGQLSGSEDLYLDGEVEGTVDLPGHTLTIGPSGRIRANISARIVSIQGTVTGNVRGSDKVELKNSAVLTGDIATKRIAIDDGAFFKGGVDIQKESAPERPASTGSAGPTASSTGSAAPSSSGGSSTGSAAKTEQPSLQTK